MPRITYGERLRAASILHRAARDEREMDVAYALTGFYGFEAASVAPYGCFHDRRSERCDKCREELADFDRWSELKGN